MKTKKIFTNKKVVVVLAIMTCFFWGSAFPTIKTGYEVYGISQGDIASQILFAGIRFTLAGILIIIVGSLFLRRLPRIEIKKLPKVIHLSLFQTIGQYVFFYMGLAKATGTNGAIIDGSCALVTVVIAGLFYKEDKMTITKSIGCIMGFLGIAIVAVSGGTSDIGFTITGEGFILIATLANGYSAILIKRYSQEINPVYLCGYQFIFGGMTMALGAFISGGCITGIDSGNIIILIYLAMLSMIAYTTWTVLLKYNSAAKVGVYGFLIPVFGVILSAIVLKENPANISTISALALVCIGIYMVNRKTRLKSRSTNKDC
ncbi:MAG: DMT family transporter [Peptostreptococcaceae bacterium]|nr:DMT family transporter [Peptostreptococcaceae bacterium]